MNWRLSCFLVSLAVLMGVLPLHAQPLLLRNNLQQAKPGDYLVISANKTQTLLHIYDKKGDLVTIEEVATPEGGKPEKMSWKEWIQQRAPGNTSWVMYELDLKTGQMVRYYSFTKKNWYEIPDADNFLSKLLNLRLTKIPESSRKKVGPKPFSGPDWRPLWQPNLIVEGKIIKGVPFDAWETRWPKDSSDLSGKTIEIYLPQDSQRYPAYFPYWLQINGAIGKAKVRMIDSGSNMQSPQPSLNSAMKIRDL